MKTAKRNIKEIKFKGHRIRPYKGAGVMLFRFNRKYRRFEVLLGKRSTPRGYGQWAIPGGGMEFQDIDFGACAFREFREETGVDINHLLAKNLAVKRIDVPFYHWRTFLVLTWGYFPELRPSEFSEFRWVPVSGIGKYDLWISLKREMKAFARIVRKHGLIVSHLTGMPYEDEKLLEAFNVLCRSKDKSPRCLSREMNLSEIEIDDIFKRLKNEGWRFENA